MPHAHSTAAAAHRGRLATVFALTVGVFVVELAGGFASNSLALLADAGHMFTDVAGHRPRPAARSGSRGGRRTRAGPSATCGSRSSRPSSTRSCCSGSSAFILFEAWRRLSEPPEIASGLMLVDRARRPRRQRVSLFLLREAQRESLNMRGTYLEVMGDFAGSAAVIVAAIVIGVTGWTQADAVASVLIGLLIIPRTWRLLRDAVDVLLEATPKGDRPRRGPGAHPRGPGRGRRPRPPRLDDHLRDERRVGPRRP